MKISRSMVKLDRHGHRPRSQVLGLYHNNGLVAKVTKVWSRSPQSHLHVRVFIHWKNINVLDVYRLTYFSLSFWICCRALSIFLIRDWLNSAWKQKCYYKVQWLIPYYHMQYTTIMSKRRSLSLCHAKTKEWWARVWHAHPHFGMTPNFFFFFFLKSVSYQKKMGAPILLLVWQVRTLRAFLHDAAQFSHQNISFEVAQPLVHQSIHACDVRVHTTWEDI